MATYNLCRFGDDIPAAKTRRDDVIDVVRGLDVQVLAVQGIGGPDLDSRISTLDALAADSGLRCRLEGRPAMAAGAGRYAVAVLWHRDLVPAAVVLPEVGDFTSRVATVVLAVGGGRIAVGSYQGTPAGSHQRIDDAQRLAMCLTRDGFDGAVVGGDFADTPACTGPAGEYLDADWTTGTGPHPDLAYLAEWAAEQVVRADRRAALALERAGLPDAVGLLGGPVEVTCGHWSADVGPRRADRWHVTTSLTGALHSVHVTATAAALRASNHLPVTLTLNPELLTHRPHMPEGHR